MEMEVDESSAATAPTTTTPLFVCCISKKGGLKKSKIEVGDVGNLSLGVLKDSVMAELNQWEWADATEKPTDIDILHCSRVLRTDEDVKRVGPSSVISVINKSKLGPNPVEEKLKSEKFIAEYAKSKNLPESAQSCHIALKTAFLSSKFSTTIQNLADSDLMQNIFAMVPEIKHDPTAIAMIQIPHVIYHLAGTEYIKKLATVRPWVIEAFHYISTAVCQDASDLGVSQGLPHNLFQEDLAEGDESMEEGDDDENSPDPSPRGALITREQLASALSALGGAVPSSSSNAFRGLFQPTPPASSRPQQPTRPQPIQNPSPGLARAGANIQNLMDQLSGAGGGTPGQPLNSEVVARAVTEALRRLTPEQRADQLNAIRSFASQLQQEQAVRTQPTDAASTPAQPTAAVPTQPDIPQDGSSSSLAQQYESQLRQMRDLGITDERLSILALRVSEGDVNTAAELIFSGWQGEGSDPL